MKPSLPRIVVATNMYPTLEDPARGAFVRAQVEALRELNVEVEVVHVRGDVSSLNYLRAVGAIRRAVRAFQADVVYAFYGLTGWVALWQPVPMVLSLAGDDVLGTPSAGGGLTVKSRIAILLTQWAAARASAICVQSQEMRQRIWSRHVRDRTLIVPYGVDPRRFFPGDRGLARAKLGLPQEGQLVLFPNTPTEYRKRIDLAKAAMAIVQRAVPDAQLRVVTRVPHSDMPEYYRAADCCLLTSDWEGSPNVVKEALLSGLPVVSTDVGDVRKWLALSPESLVSDRTPEALAKAIIGVLQRHLRVDPAPFIDLYSSQAIARQMITLFRRASDCAQSDAQAN